MVVVLFSVRVTPWMALATVFEALVIAMPFTVRLAFWAATVWVIFSVPPVVGSYASKVFKAADPVVVIWRLLLAPELFEVRTRRYGVLLPSLTMVADTPILAALIASLIPCSELLLLFMLMLVLPLEAKVAAAPP